MPVARDRLRQPSLGDIPASHSDAQVRSASAAFSAHAGPLTIDQQQTAMGAASLRKDI
jgi:hypothetical protein